MSEALPLVCVCIPTYNSEKTIGSTLQSILNQSYHNLVIKIVDNASTDKTLLVVESFLDPRLQIIRNAVNVGGEGNFDRCIEIAEGAYTAIYHSDDIYMPSIIEREVEFLKRNLNVGAVFTRASLIDECGRVFGKTSVPNDSASSDNTYSFDEIFKLTLKLMNFLVCPSAMVRTDIYKNEICRWRADLFASSSDLDVWFRILDAHQIGIIPEELMQYRIGAQQFSAGLKIRVERSDFFLVMDYYLKQEKIQRILTNTDLKNYRWLERVSYVTQATKLFLLGRDQEARFLCQDILTIDAIQAAFSSRLALKALLSGCCLRFFMAFDIQNIGRLLIQRFNILNMK
jgi:glycosyltransferase involved in cell wall biosynthesis